MRAGGVRLARRCPSIGRTSSRRPASETGGIRRDVRGDRIGGTLDPAALISRPPGCYSKMQRPPLGLPHDVLAWTRFVRDFVDRYGPGGAFWASRPALPASPTACRSGTSRTSASSGAASRTRRITCGSCDSHADGDPQRSGGAASSSWQACFPTSGGTGVPGSTGSSSASSGSGARGPPSTPPGLHPYACKPRVVGSRQAEHAESAEPRQGEARADLGHGVRLVRRRPRMGVSAPSSDRRHNRPAASRRLPAAAEAAKRLRLIAPSGSAGGLD